MSERIQLRRTKGWRMPPGAVSVARPGRWGNPHKVGPITAAEAVALYEADLLAGRLRVTVADVRRDLAGRDLACWCRLGEPCHADVLLRVANEEEVKLVRKYQPMPPLAPEEREALKESIRANGYDPAHPVVTDEDGNTLDGHHREDVCAELGIEPPKVVLPGLTEGQKREYAIRANLARRHVSQQQRRDLIRAELDRDPSRRPTPTS